MPRKRRKNQPGLSLVWRDLAARDGQRRSYPDTTLLLMPLVRPRSPSELAAYPGQGRTKWSRRDNGKGASDNGYQMKPRQGSLADLVPRAHLIDRVVRLAPVFVASLEFRVTG